MIPNNTTTICMVTQDVCIKYSSPVGKQLAELHAKRGFTTRQLAEMAGVSYSNINKIERGAYNVSVDILGKVCNALGAKIKIE